MRKLLLIGAALAAIVASASAQSLTTLFARNNGGSFGGAVYFDVIVGPNDLTVTGFDTNTAELVPFGWSVYTRLGTGMGNELAPDWALVATGTGQGNGIDVPSPVTLNSSFNLLAGTSYGMALVMGPEAGHDYTNGDGTNQAYNNADLSLRLGSATNVPFTGTVFNPRVWNGTIYYQAVPEPASIAALGLGALALLRRRKAKRQ